MNSPRPVRQTEEQRRRAGAQAMQQLLRFFRTESASGMFLLAGALAGLVWINAPFGDSYHELFEHSLHLNLGPIEVLEDVHGWINEGLMTIFFFVVGMEIKRELVVGELSDPRQAALPVIAAAGGMVMPAAIYAVINAGEAGFGGWGIPVATDIAFAVGVLALLGDRIPAGLKLFLLALAIADDVGGIIIIAVFYSSNFSLGWFLGALGGLGLMVVMRRAGIAPVIWYVPVGVAVWYATFEAGIEPTIAGVAIALLTPVGAFRGTEPMEQLETVLTPVSAFVIVPLFALANAGVEVSTQVVGDVFSSRVALGIIAGLVVGKTVGISLATLIAIRSKVGTLATGVTERQVVGVAALSGVGFTVALFIANLSFPSSPHLLDEAKVGILLASGAAALIGVITLRAVSPLPQPPHPDPPEGDEARSLT